MAETPDNALMLEILKEIRKEVRDVRTLALQLVDRGDRLERHMVEIERRLADAKEDMALMVKAELMGALGNFETRIMVMIEERLADGSTH
jgi:hypothetical protein